MTNEDKALRFGVIAVKKGFVSAEQVIEALNTQVREDISNGKHRKIGMILLEQGHLTPVQIDEVVKELEALREISE